MELSHSEYRILVEQAPIMVWRSDPTGLCDYFNETWLAFTGRTHDQERGEGWSQGVHPDDLQSCLSIYTRAFAARVPFEMEYRLRRYDGVHRWIFDRGAPFVGGDGEFGGFIGSCVDVTERVVAEETIRRASEAELKTLRSSRTGSVPNASACTIRSRSGGLSRGLAVELGARG